MLPMGRIKPVTKSVDLFFIGIRQCKSDTCVRIDLKLTTRGKKGTVGCIHNS